MADFFRRRFRWKNGQVVVELPDDEQDMLRHVLPQLRELVTVSYTHLTLPTKA